MRDLPRTPTYDKLTQAEQWRIDDEEEPNTSRRDSALRREREAKAIKRKERQDLIEYKDLCERKPFGHDGKVWFYPSLVEHGFRDAALIGGIFKAMGRRKIPHDGEKATEWHTPKELQAYLGCSRQELWRIIRRLEPRLNPKKRRRPLDEYLAHLLKVTWEDGQLWFSPRQEGLKFFKKQHLEYIPLGLFLEIGVTEACLYQRVKADTVGRWEETPSIVDQKIAGIERERGEEMSRADRDRIRDQAPLCDQVSIPRQVKGRGFKWRQETLMAAFPWLKSVWALRKAFRRLMRRGLIILERIGREFIYRVPDHLLGLSDQNLLSWLKRGGGGRTAGDEKMAKPQCFPGKSKDHIGPQVTVVGPQVTVVGPEVTVVGPEVTRPLGSGSPADNYEAPSESLSQGALHRGPRKTSDPSLAQAVTAGGPASPKAPTGPSTLGANPAGTSLDASSEEDPEGWKLHLDELEAERERFLT